MRIAWGVSFLSGGAYSTCMNASEATAPRGSFDARYLAFLETVAQLRPRLHRYCSRMTGSVLDGEDVVQDALFEAYRKLETFDDSRPLTPWLFRIAHNRCIDFLRRRKVRSEAEAESVAGAPEWVEPHEFYGADVAQALEHVVGILPPRERACILLKDVFDYSLEEVSDYLGSTIGAVKAALNRGRTKLASSPRQVPTARAETPDQQAILLEYVTRFNRRDWDGVRALIGTDAGVLVADRFSGSIGESPYFGNYERWQANWRLAPGRVDDRSVVAVLVQEASAWRIHSVIQLSVVGDRIAKIVDYGHCGWVLDHAGEVTFEAPDS